MQHPRGALMLETLIALGVSALFMSALLGYVFIANTGTDRARENAAALWATQEGLDALKTIAFTELANTTTGSLAFASNRWAVSNGGPQTLPDGATRTVKIEDVMRDGACAVVTTGGTIDPDSKKITSETTWIDSSSRSHTVSLGAIRTQWDDPQGDCFGATMATSVSWAVEGAVWSGGKQLRNLWFTNTGGNAVTVDNISFTWSNSAKMSQLFMDTTKVWSSTGPGTPLHTLSSGEEMDIEDFVVPPSSSGELNKGQFDINMVGVCLTMTVEFTDESAWTSPTFCPG